MIRKYHFDKIKEGSPCKGRAFAVLEPGNYEETTEEKNKVHISGLAFCPSSGGMVVLVTALVQRKDNVVRLNNLYRYGKEYDVLFFGPSVVHMGISPMQLWKEYGIASYNCSNDSEHLTQTYYTILNVLDYTSPELIVVDLVGMDWAGNARNKYGKDHNFLDTIPLSLHKVQAVCEIFPRSEWKEYLFPAIAYHERWRELEQKDFSLLAGDVKYGFDYLDFYMETEQPTEAMWEASMYGDVEAERKNIERIVELCEKENIQLIFTYLPIGVYGGD